MPAPFLLHCYAALVSLTAIAMPLWLRRRVALGKESALRWRERFGETSLPKPSGPVIWCHAASVGETTSVLPLINALAARGHYIVLTTGTVTSERIVRDKLPNSVTHQFAPLDHRPWIARFLNQWQPALAIRVDSELWPNTISMLSMRGIVIVQINARLSASAAKRWNHFPKFANAIFSRLSLVLAQSEADRARYQTLGAPKTAYLGNLKLSQPNLPYNGQELESLKQAMTGRAVWTAASIHPGEEHIIGAAHLFVRTKQPHALVIVVPRHPERGDEMTTHLQALGLTVAQRSHGDAIKPQTDVYMADTLGELGLFYRLSPIAFIGKSFAVGGGQNPIEAAQLGCALVWGPDVSNFAAITEDLKTQGAGITVNAPEKLGEAIAGLLLDPKRTAEMTKAGQSYINASRGTLERVLDNLAPYLKQAAIR